MYIYGAILAALLPTVSCIFADEAYQVDFHYALLGEPQSSSTFFHQPVKGSKASLLYTVSNKSVLGAVNPKDGAILWRQALSSNHSCNPGIAATSYEHDAILSFSGSDVSSWSAADGRLVWERSFGNEEVRHLAVEHGAQKDTLVVVQASDTFRVLKLDSSTGSVKWTYEDTSGDIPYRVVESSSNVYLISLHPTMLKGLKIKVTSLNRDSGKSNDQHTLSSDGDIYASKDIIFVGSATSYPIIAWSDFAKKVVKVNILGTKDIQSIETAPSGAQVEDIAVHTSDRLDAVVVLHYQTSEMHWADIFELDKQKPILRKIRTLPSVHGRGAFSVNQVDDKVCFVRITEVGLDLFSSTSDTALASWPVNFALPGMSDKPAPLHATSEVAIRSGSSYAVRSAVLLSSGDWVLIRNGEVVWSRPESLAGIVKARWADVSDNEDLAQDLEIESSGNLLASFIHRSMRHLNNLKNFPTWLQSLLPTTDDKTRLIDGRKMDKFGFSKLLIVTTETGRSIALDVGDRGRIVWNKSDLDQPESSLADATQRAEDQRRTEETGYSLENGILRGKSKGEHTLWSFKAIPGYRIISVMPQMKFEPVASIGKVLGDRRVLYKYLNPNAVLVMAVDESKSKAIATLLDTVSGNVLYSSEHKNVDASRPIATAISENWMTFSYTVDSTLDSVSKGFQLVMAEFYESDSPDNRGYFDIASNYSALQGSSPPSRPYVISQSFHVPEEITKMAVSQTGQGITSRQLLVGLSDTHSIVGIPSRILDPRRTVGLDPTYAQMEEGLSRYTPMIDFDPQWYLNHQEQILGVREILTTPSSLESTSLVVAFGLDVFGTRVSPSFAFDILGNSFNKIQLVLTVLALLIGVFIVAPLIQRKQTDALWQSS